LTAPIAMSVQDAAIPLQEVLKALPECQSLSDVMLALNPIKQSLTGVWGTATSGALILASNLGLTKMFAKKANMASEEGRQDNRLKEMFANAVGVARWIPQMIQGLKTPGWETETAAAAGAAGYAIGLAKQSAEYIGRVIKPGFKLEKSSKLVDIFMRKAPGIIMVARGPLQGAAAIAAGVNVHPLVGAAWGVAAVLQTAAGAMIYSRDKKYKAKPAAPKPPES
jgi:hypothetical protein